MRKSIEGYPGYEVDDQGNIYSLKFGKVRKLKGRKNTGGYYQVVLYKDGRRKTYYIHRLVAEAFIPNPHNHPQVDHKNGDRTDNRISNLRWLTNQENQWNQTKAKGFTFDKHAGKYKAKIKVDRKTISLGYHDTEEKARAAYLAGKAIYHVIE